MKKLNDYLNHQLQLVGNHAEAERRSRGRDKAFDYLNKAYDELSGVITGAFVVEALTDEEADKLQDWLADEIDKLFDAVA